MSRTNKDEKLEEKKDEQKPVAEIPAENAKADGQEQKPEEEEPVKEEKKDEQKPAARKPAKAETEEDKQADAILKLYPQYKELYIDSKGGAFTVGTPEHIRGKAKLYKNKYFK